MYPKQLDVFLELDKSLPQGMTEQWKTISLEPVQLPSGQWTSPFQANELPGG